jgi:hypothetical protein
VSLDALLLYLDGAFVLLNVLVMADGFCFIRE